MKTIILSIVILTCLMHFVEASLASTQATEVGGITNIPLDLNSLLPIVVKQNNEDIVSLKVNSPEAFSVLCFQKVSEIPLIHTSGWFLIYRVWGGTWNGKSYGDYAAVLIDKSGNRIVRIPPIGANRFRFDSQCESGFAIQSSANSLSAVMICSATKWDSAVIMAVALDQTNKVQFAFSGSNDNPLSVDNHPVDETLRVVWSGNVYFKDFDKDGLLDILVSRHTDAKQSLLLFKFNPSTNSFNDVTASKKSKLAEYLLECGSDKSIPSVSL